MSIESTESELIQILSTYLDTLARDERVAHVRIVGSTDLQTDLEMQSIQIMEFLMRVEDHFDISIDLESLSNARTVIELASIVYGRPTLPQHE